MHLAWYHTMGWVLLVWEARGVVPWHASLQRVGSLLGAVLALQLSEWHCTQQQSTCATLLKGVRY
jgi:hypothetical protein